MQLCLGTAQFGSKYGVANNSGKPSAQEAQKIIEFAKANSIEFIDTAIAYGDSESALGQIGISGFQIITKLPKVTPSVDRKNWVTSQLEASFARLKVSHLYAVLLHRSEDLFDERGFEIYNALLEHKKSNLIQKVGVSVYSVKELEKCLQSFDLDIIQIPFNLIDRSVLTSGWLEKLKEKKIEVHVRSAFLQGLLLMSKEDIPKQFTKWDEIWSSWENFILRTNISKLDACIGFLKQQSTIDKIVVGVDRLSHLTEILRSYNNPVKYDFSGLASMSSEDDFLINPSLWSKH